MICMEALQTKQENIVITPTLQTFSGAHLTSFGPLALQSFAVTQCANRCIEGLNTLNMMFATKRSTPFCKDLSNWVIALNIHALITTNIMRLFNLNNNMCFKKYLGQKGMPFQLCIEWPCEVYVFDTSWLCRRSFSSLVYSPNCRELNKNYGESPIKNTKHI